MASSDPDLLRALNSGIRQQLLVDGLAAAQHPPVIADSKPVSADPDPFLQIAALNPQLVSEAAERRSFAQSVRTVGRHALRLTRPLLLPVLHRLEWRIRTAFDKTGLAEQTAAGFREVHETMARSLDQGAGLTRQTELLGDALGAARGEILAGSVEITAARHEIAISRTEAGVARVDIAALRSLVEVLRGELAAVEAVLLQRDPYAILTGIAGDTQRLLQRATIPLKDGDTLVRTGWGWLATPCEDERLLMAMVETAGVLEPGSCAVLCALLRPGDTMVDVGAHIGTMTLPAARVVGPTGRVVAVEPGLRASGLLARSLHINSVSTWTSLHVVAAGAADGEAVLHLSDVLGENTLVHEATAQPTADGAIVPVRALDTLVDGRVDVVKIDVEGYELQVWRGMSRILAENPRLAVIVELGPEHVRRAGGMVEGWLAEFRASGFIAWEIDERTGEVRPLRRLEDLASLYSMNLLLLRVPPSDYPTLCVQTVGVA